jgi:hypothetical protein
MRLLTKDEARPICRTVGLLMTASVARHLFILQQNSVINPIRAALPTLALLRRSGAKASRNYRVSSPIGVTNGCPRLRVHAWSR